MAEVGFEHVSKSFGRKRSVVCAMDDLSLVVSDGELLVVVGPSGCGKTTLLRLLAGLEEPSSGVIRIDERVVNDVPPRDRDVAMVFQDYALYPHMTVFRNLAFGLKMRKVPKAQITAKVVEAARWLGIESLLDRRPAALSGGERQRVAVGRAIVRHPRVFLFDEPLASLDAGLRVQMRTEIRSLHRRLGTTMIYVTHDQEEAMTLGDRIAVIRDGRLQQCGTPLDVYDRPANRFVAGFVGDPAMNLFQAPLHRDGNDVWLDCPWGRVGLCSDSASRMSASDKKDVSEVIVGIRPEDLVIEPAHDSSANPVAPELESAPVTRATMRVDAIEPLGNATNVHLRLEQAPPDGLGLVARVWPRHHVTPGSQVEVTIDAARLHLFATDPQGERLN